MSNVVFLEDKAGYWEASVQIRRKKVDGKHPADNMSAIEKALKDVGYEVTSLRFSTPDFMTPIEKSNESPEQ